MTTPADVTAKFSALPLSPALSQGLDALGYTTMTPVQAQALPPILEGRDVIAQAPTGSGKTAAFGLGLLHRLDPADGRTQALVLCPTRELADQVGRHLRKLATGIPNLKLSVLCGGIPLGPQLASLAHPPQVVVGTPGRVLELVQKEKQRIAVLKERKDKVKCLVCMYGVPLRVGGQTPTEEERKELQTFEPQIKELEGKNKTLQDEIKQLTDIAKSLPLLAGVEVIKTQKQKEVQEIQGKLVPLNRRRQFLNYAESYAAVDSELMLLWWEKYELRRWQINLNNFQVTEKQRAGKQPVLLACRLDGPSPEIVKRMIDDAIATEKEGLKGITYVDARGIKFDAKGTDTGHGYGGYDESMREMAKLLKEAKYEVVLDDKNELFGVGSCPDCALYCGWYSHANFIDSCKFVRGAVAWHLASSEAVSLRRKDAKYWCKNLLERGACATLGPVGEPYTIGFPKPAEFFGYLATGKYTLAESYGKTVLFASWMGTLVGDPLYNPFKKNGTLAEKEVLPSPKGGRNPFAEKE